MVPNSPSQADTGVLSLMQGVVAAEGSGGNPTALGDYNAQKQATAAGIGMWSNEDPQGIPQPLQQGEIPTHFAQMAKEYGLNPTDFSIGNQNKVLYAELATDKAQGLSPAQALSKWNSGRANAYQTSPVEGSSVSATGTSNVGAYVQKGLAAAQKYAQSQGQNGQSNGQQDVVSGAGNVGLNSIPVTSLGGGQIPQGSQPSPIPITQLNLPPSATDNSASSQSLPAGVPAQPFSTPLSDIASGNGANGVQRGIGALKGIGQVMSQVGGTSGGNPVVNAMLANAPGFNKDVQALNSAVQPSNFSQSQGAAESNIGAGLIAPEGQAASDIAAATEAGIPDVAKAIASEKATLGTVTKGLISLGGDSGAAKDAKAIEPMVAQGVLKAGTDAKTTLSNIAALKNAIVDTAQGVMSRLQSMTVKPILQPEDLSAILKQQMDEIEKNLPPSQQETAKATAQWLWQKFVDNLPKGQDATPDVVLRARQITDQAISQIKGQNVFDPATENGYTVALRALRQGVNDWVIKNAPDQAVEEALSHQTSLYNVLQNVGEKGAAAVRKAQQVAELGGRAGFVARHPIISTGIGSLISGGLIGAGMQESGAIGGAIHGLLSPSQ